MADDRPEVDLTVMLATFEARMSRIEELASLLARYVVLTRRRAECRNVDLISSVLEPGRFVVIEKWGSPDAQRAHMDEPETVALAEGCRDLLSGPPRFDLCEGVSAHDLS
jgi:quinol monooxygenase YgiN